MSNNPEQFKKPTAYIECICPTCGVKHKLRIFWTGTCTPRKYCKEHSEASKTVECDEYGCFLTDGRTSIPQPDQNNHPMG